MKKLSFLAIALLCANTAYAHRVWVQTGHMHGGDILKASIGYGEFPTLEAIAEDRLHIFSKPMQLIGPAGKEDLLQKGEFNYQYESAKPLSDGSYLVLAEYQPTFWSKNKDGWKQVNMKEMPDATYCEQTRMYGKNILNVGHESAAVDVISRPVGQGLEIVPLDNPANIHVSEPFPVKVLFNGEPLVGATLTATFEGFDVSDRSKTHKVEAQAFSDTTLADGTVNILPLRQGFWKASVEHKTDFPEAGVCQKLASYTTMTFEIGQHHH